MKKRKKDIIILLSILGLALFGLLANHFIFQHDGDVFCKIIVDGELVDTVNLTTNKTFSIAERPNIVFEIKEDAIAFIKSDCPDQVCVHSGFLKHNGQSASCLPNKTTIAIHARNQDVGDPDIVIGFGGEGR